MPYNAVCFLLTDWLSWSSRSCSLCCCPTSASWCTEAIGSDAYLDVWLKFYWLRFLTASIEVTGMQQIHPNKGAYLLPSRRTVKHPNVTAYWEGVWFNISSPNRQPCNKMKILSLLSEVMETGQVVMIRRPVTGWLQKCALESQALHKRICLWISLSHSEEAE